MAKRVLVVDDRQMMRDSIERSLRRAGYVVISAESAAAAIDRLDLFEPDVVLTDLRMAGGDGLTVAKHVRDERPRAAVVLMTAHGSVESAVAAMKLGAVDFIQKPFSADVLLSVIEQAVAAAEARQSGVARQSGEAPRDQSPRDEAGQVTADESQQGDGRPGRADDVPQFVGDAPATINLRGQLLRVSQRAGSVLITGEPGAGKTLAGRLIHHHGSGARSPLVTLMCSGLRTLPREQLDGTTVLLQEVADLSPDLQAELVSLIESGDHGAAVERVIATTTRDLAACVVAGGFREDLFYRLSVLPIHLPPLRDRLADVPLLVRHFVDAADTDRPLFSDEALDLMQHNGWPGNVRQLQNLCRWAQMQLAGRPLGAGAVRNWLAGSDTAGTGVASAEIAPSEPAARTEAAPAAANVVQRLEDVERQQIVRALEVFDGNRQRTATALGIGVRTLGLKLKKWKENKLVAQSL